MTKILSLKTVIAASLVGLSLLAMTAQAKADHHEFHDRRYSIEGKAEKADLVFRGTITDIAYNTSDNGNPFTFVTYQIIDVIAGDYTDPTITLMFAGGFVDDKRRVYQLSSEMPTFDLGDEDIMYVKDNDMSACPLVDCAGGRIRVVDGILQTDGGNELLEVSGSDDLEIGARLPSERVDTHHAGDATFRIEHSEIPETKFDPMLGVTVDSGILRPEPGRRIGWENAKKKIKKFKNKTAKKVRRADHTKKVDSKKLNQGSVEVNSSPPVKMGIDAIPVN